MREAVHYATKIKPQLLEERQKELEDRRKAIEEGDMLPTKRHLGKRKYQARALEFRELEDIDPKLKNVDATNEALREQYDSIYRRGLLEPFNTQRAKKKGSLKPIKWVTNPNKRWKEANQARGGAFGVIGADEE